MNDGSILEGIQDLNLSYLLLVQRLLREDRAMALFRLNMTTEQADFLAKLSGKQLGQLARSGQLVCRFAFEDVTRLERILESSRDHGLEQLHVALLMTSSGRETGGRVV
ncbi:MAG: flagellar transcriptional regulator FlhD [Pseudomonas sp.]